MSVIHRFLTVCAMLVLAGCDPDFEPASRVTELRVLAVQADQPFALPGQQVQLRALYHDPLGRDLSWGWGLCFDETSSLAIDCLRALSFESLTIGAAHSEHRVEIPDNGAPYVGVVVIVCPGSIVSGDTLGVPVACVDPDGRPLPREQFELGLKRIYVRDPALNQNPTFSELLWDGAPWPDDEVKDTACTRVEDGVCTAWAEHTLELRAPDAAEQSVDREGHPLAEQAVIQLYANGGEFGDDLRIASDARTTWRARGGDAGKVVTLWFVLRDDRGGVSWLTRSLRVP